MSDGFSFPRISGLNTGRINDFVNGIEEAHDKNAIAIAKVLGTVVAVNAWSAYRMGRK